MKNEHRTAAVWAGIATGIILLIAAVRGCSTSDEGLAPGDGQTPPAAANTVGSFSDLKSELERNNLTVVTGIDRAGNARTFFPDNAKVEPAEFPVAAKSISRPIGAIIVPFTVNPSCILVNQTGTQNWWRVCG